jgi:ubiquinone/menaquinone biosynthesis C-methylase UbiE
MTDQPDAPTHSVKATVAHQFDAVAERYRTSAIHASGSDLDQLVQTAALQGHERVLDAGCGAGHTAVALAPYAAQVIAVDLSSAMLVQARQLAHARGVHNVCCEPADVEALTFPDASFDLVVSRYSAHHWPHPLRAAKEFQRVLRPGGRLLLADIVSWDTFVVDSYLQAVEILRDPSHVRDHTVPQWLALLTAAGFRPQIRYRWPLHLRFDDWIERMATPAPAAAMARQLLLQAPAEVRSALYVESDGSFTLQGCLLEGLTP